MKKTLILLVLLVGFSKIGFTEDMNFSFYKNILLSDKYFAKSEFGLFLEGMHDEDFDTIYGVFKPDNKEFYYFGDCRGRVGGVFVLFSVKENKPVFHSWEFECTRSISLDDLNGDGVEDLVLYTEVGGMSFSNKYKYLFFYHEGEIELFKYSEYSGKSDGNVVLPINLSGEILTKYNEKKEKRDEYGWVGISTFKSSQTVITIPQNAFPSDYNFKKQTTITYKFETNDEMEFLKEIVDYVVANSNYEKVDCCTIRLEK